MPTYRPLTDEERRIRGGRTGEPATPIRPTIGRPDREPGYRPPPPNPNRIYPPTTPPPTLPTSPGPPNRRPPTGAMPNDINQDPSFGPDQEENLGEDETYARLVKKQDSGMELTQEERGALHL
jgi:hypothetical protein